MLARSVLCAVVLGLAGLLPALPADAGPVTCELRNSATGYCLIEVRTPPRVSPILDPDSARDNGGTAPTCQNSRAEPIPCLDPARGSWSAVRNCYVARADPQPPPGDPLWEGRTDGAIYVCAAPPFFLPGMMSAFSYPFWSAAPPDAAVMTPEQAAQVVVAGMDLRAIDIGIVPESGARSVGLVGLPVWMWTEETANTWGPLAKTATAGGVSITAVAKVQQVDWDMGDGSIVTCATAGTAYEDRYGDQMSPDCGHKYTQTSVGLPGNAYRVSATSHWQIDWSGGGASGRLSLELTAETQLQVGELQVLVS